MQNLSRLKAQLEEVIDECMDRRLTTHALVDRLRAAAEVLPYAQKAHDEDAVKKQKEQEQE